MLFLFPYLSMLWQLLPEERKCRVRKVDLVVHRSTLLLMDYMDLSKLLHVLVMFITCISHRMPPKIKLKFDQNSKLCWILLFLWIAWYCVSQPQSVAIGWEKRCKYLLINPSNRKPSSVLHGGSDSLRAREGRAGGGQQGGGGRLQPRDQGRVRGP